MHGGDVRIIDISKKPVTTREATVAADIRLQPETIKLIREKKIRKGDVLTVAKCAAILAAKKVDELIPLCHSLPLEYVGIDFELKKNTILIRATCRTRARTGVEMEAMVAASVAALTIYDMCKSVDRGAVIGRIRLMEKRGGKSGHYERR